MALSLQDTPLDLKAPLRNVWYHVVPSHRLKAGKMTSQLVMGEPILFGRTLEGKVFGLRNICPHRGVPLSFGTFDGKEITCHFHGWRYSPAGRCMAIPTMVEGQDIDISRIGTRAYEVREWQGNIWVWMGEPRTQYPDLPMLPEFIEMPVRMDF